MADGTKTLIDKITNGGAYDAGDMLENKGQRLEFYHVPSMTSVVFKAILKTYNENYVSNWTPVNVFGRNDPIQNFQGTQRSLSLAWEVVAFSLDGQGSAENNMAKCSTLARMLYPQYADVTSATSISKAPLIKIRFSNLIYDGAQSFGADASTTGLLGVIKNLSWTPSLDAGFLDPDTRLYPKVIDISIGFDVLHQHPLGWQAAHPYEFPDDVKAQLGGNDVPAEKRALDKEWKNAKKYSAAPGWMGGSNFPWGRALGSGQVIDAMSKKDYVDLSREETSVEQVDAETLLNGTGDPTE